MKPIEVKKLPLKGYSIAPYNFVSFPKKAVVRYKDPTYLPAHNNFKNRDGKELLSGTIEYTLEAMTPIIVSDSKEEKDSNNTKNVYFFTNANGQYAIPGNTVRGLIRTNCQILSFSNVINTHEGDDCYSESEIQDSRFLFRDVAGNGSLARKYRNILDIDRVKRVSRSLKAGYMVNEDNKYYIEESEKLNNIRNYFRIAEIDLRKVADKDIMPNINFMYKEDLKNYEKKLKELNKIISKKNAESKNANIEKYRILRDNKNKNYKPYSIEVSFSLDSKNVRIAKVGPKDRYGNNGFLLSGGFIDGKMSHYIVPAPDPKLSRICVSEDDIESYKDDLVMTRKMNKSDETILPDYEFFGLPKKGQKKPVFFINTNRLHFGFTPYLRMFYSKTVLDGIDSLYKDVIGISYTDGIFGFTNRKFKKGKDLISYNYKSRVSFEDAVVEGEGIVDEDSTMTILLAGPKPTSYNLYLNQELDKNKNELNIYEDDFRIRGIKQYWLKDYIEKLNIEESKMTSTIHPLKEGTIFRGRVHFKNLEKDELGLILWALRLEEGCYQSIGMAKPYGFGRVKVKDIKLEIEDLEKKYGKFSFDYTKGDDIEKYIRIYKEEFSSNYLNGQNIEKQLPIEEFFYIKKTVIKKEDSSWYRYMELKEFRDRKVLPSILKYDENVKRDNNNLNPNRKKQANYMDKANHKSGKFSNKNEKNSELLWEIC